MMAAETTQDAQRVAQAAAHAFARFWLSECSKIEEQVLDPAARWDIMRDALLRIANGDRS